MISSSKPTNALKSPLLTSFKYYELTSIMLVNWNCIGFEVLTAVVMKSSILWDIMLF
jgi:hypothetical protein